MMHLQAGRQGGAGVARGLNEGLQVPMSQGPLMSGLHLLPKLANGKPPSPMPQPTPQPRGAHQQAEDASVAEAGAKAADRHAIVSTHSLGPLQQRRHVWAALPCHCRLCQRPGRGFCRGQSRHSASRGSSLGLDQLDLGPHRRQADELQEGRCRAYNIE